MQTGGAATDTGLQVKPGFTFLYGHVDVRFREPAGKGLWPGIWLAADGGPGQAAVVPWPPEIDLLESYGNPTIWSFHVHLAGPVDAGKDFVGPNTSTQFHTVSLDWRADEDHVVDRRQADVLVHGTEHPEGSDVPDREPGHGRRNRGRPT